MDHLIWIGSGSDDSVLRKDLQCSPLKRTFVLGQPRAGSGLKGRAGRVQTKVALTVDEPNQGQAVGGVPDTLASPSLFHADRR